MDQTPDSYLGHVLIRGRLRADFDTDGQSDGTLRITLYEFLGDDALLAAVNADPEVEVEVSSHPGRGWTPLASSPSLIPASTDLAERHRLLGEFMDAVGEPFARFEAALAAIRPLEG